MQTIHYQGVKIGVGESFNAILDYIPADKQASLFIISDENVWDYWQDTFPVCTHLIIPAGEAQKSLLRIEQLIEELIEKGADRHSFILGVGGGVICDIAGFVASVYMRGIPFGFAPTTLLAQVDASIGGKNGVNTASYKNMIGVFNQPQFILTDANFLSTLPEAIYIDGLAEVIKHACISDKAYFEYIETHTSAILSREPSVVDELVLKSVQIKAAVVEQDPHEKGLRKTLNFGHTFGHAIEKSFGLSHGQAVSLGIVAANNIAVNLGLLSATEAARISNCLAAVGLPVDISAYDFAALSDLVAKDKKKKGASIDFILLNALGEAIIKSLPVTDLADLVTEVAATQTIPAGGAYSGTLLAPASKSYLQRAIAIAALSPETVTITGYTPSKDADAAMSIATALGAEVILNNETISVRGIKTTNTPVVLHCGESGLSTRMFSAIAALYNREITLTGEGSLLKRPLTMVQDALTQLGKNVELHNGFLPLQMSGTLQAGELDIDGSESSQLLTGLLIALPLLQGDSTINVRQLKSIPYIQMTLDILEAFGIHIEHENYQVFHIKGGQLPRATHYQVEGDWSGAAFHLVGAAISGHLTMQGLNLNSSQADRAILDALKSCGAQVESHGNDLYIKKQDLKAFTFDATHCPDLFPPLAALAACCEGTSHIIGTSRLLNKESNRALTIQSELGKLGITVELSDNTMHITGGQVQGAHVNSHHDHRIAMMCAILSLVAHNTIHIHHPEAIEKSYPQFYEHFFKRKGDFRR